MLQSRCTPRHPFLLGLLLALLLSSLAVGQDSPDAIPDAVQEISQLAQQASDLLATDRDGAVAALEDALQQTDALLTELEAPGLRAGLAAIGENAASAVENGSQLNLDVQLDLLEGVLARVLFVDSLQARAAGEEIGDQLTLLSALTGTVLQGAEGDAGSVRESVERRIGSQIEEVLLGIEQDQTPASVYPRLGRAYALSLVIQDSPVLDEQPAPYYAQAARALIDGQQEEFVAAVNTLLQGANALQQPRPAAPEPEPAQAQEQEPGEGAQEAATTEEPPAQELPPIDSTASDPAPLSRALTITEPEYAFLEQEIAPYWNEANRPLTLLLLGVLALLPLLLMSRAFAGAGNAAWHLVSAAFVLLLLPALVRGAVALLELADRYYPLGFVDPASLDDLLVGPFGELTWLLTMLLGILLATLGFYRLAKQFGRLGGQPREESEPAAEGSPYPGSPS